jgi:hypothetical protein
LAKHQARGAWRDQGIRGHSILSVPFECPAAAVFHGPAAQLDSQSMPALLKLDIFGQDCYYLPVLKGKRGEELVREQS